MKIIKFGIKIFLRGKERKSLEGCKTVGFKMKITVQIKFSSEKQRIVRFGNFRYLVYICSLKEDENSMDEFNTIMSKELIVPPGRIHYKGKQGELYIFDVD